MKNWSEKQKMQAIASNNKHFYKRMQFLIWLCTIIMIISIFLYISMDIGTRLTKRISREEICVLTSLKLLIGSYKIFPRHLSILV